MVLSGPSGSGKTSITKKLAAEDNELVQSISATTRKPRDGEVEGKDYFFIDESTFSSMVVTGQMIEFTEIYGNFYGTPRKKIQERMDAGLDVIFDIDANGAKSLKTKLPEHVFSIFILPPSMDELATRLQSRGTESQMNIMQRLSNVREELKRIGEYDYVLVNDDFEKSCQIVKSILEAEIHKRSRISNVSESLTMMGLN